MGDDNHDHTVYLNGEDLTIDNVIKIARGEAKVDLSPEIKKRITDFREGLIKQLYEDPETPIYGVTRGCGDLLGSVLKKSSWEKYKEAVAIHRSDPGNKDARSARDKAFKVYLEDLEDYQIRYIKSHNCGTGEPLPIEVVRAAMVIRLNSFAKGCSAVSLDICTIMIDMLNRGLTPWVLEEGSVGASGDLAPLSMIAATMAGLPQAKAYYEGELLPAPEALKLAGIKPVKLGAKEAMAITNGATIITALALLALSDAELLLKQASVSAALTLEAVRGEKAAFSEFIALARSHTGAVKVAEQVRDLIEGSKRTSVDAQLVRFEGQLEETVRERVQDRYSIRAVPPVHGAVYEAIEKMKDTIEIEINSATDNPLLFKSEDGRYIAYSGANFHGQPLATVIDYLKLSITGLGLITNKRISALLDKYLSFGLPGDLASDPMQGDSGLMLTQYAAAARAAENRVLSTPSSIMSISTGSNQEDFVSMGTAGALHLRKVIYNTRIIIAVELLCALRAIQMTHDQLPEGLRKLGKGTGKAFEYLNRILPSISEDQYLRTDIEKMLEFLRSAEFKKEVIDLI